MSRLRHAAVRPPWARAALGLGLATAVWATAAMPVVAQSPSAGAATQITIAGTDTFSNLDPTELSGTDSLVANMVWDFLIEPGPDGNTAYRLAESFTPNEDGTVWTAKLRENAAWSDGTPFTAADVLYSYHLHASPVLSEVPSLFDDLTGIAEWREGTADSIAGLTAPDDHTVVFTLDEPNAAFGGTLLDFRLFIVRDGLVGDPSGLTLDEYQRNPVWSKPPVAIGPLKLVNTVPDQYLEFEPNPGWYGTPVQWDKVVLRLIPVGVQAAALQAGDLDVAMISIDDIERMQELGYQTAVAIAPYPIVSKMNTVTSPLSDVRVRQAFAYGCDTKSFVDAYYKGHGTYSTSYIQAPWVSTEGLNPYLYDPVKAKSLLDEAGFDYSQTIRWLGYDDTSIDQGAYLEQCQAQLGELGVKIEIIRGPDKVMSFADAGDFALHTGGGFYSTFDPDLLSPVLTCAGLPGGPTPGHYQKVVNEANWCDPAVDAAFEAARRVTDQAKRAELYHQASLILNDQLPYWVNLPVPTAYAWKDVDGFVPYGEPSAYSAAISEWSPAP